MVEQETVRAVVEAYGAGQIELDQIEPGTRKRTGESVASFLGWHNVDKVKYTACRLGHLRPRGVRGRCEAVVAS